MPSFIIIYQEGVVYWKDLKEDLFNIVNKWQKNIKIEPEELKKIQKNIRAFCEQGTGHKKTIYNFINLQLNRQISTENNKKKYEEFVKKISELCSCLNNYLKKHPKKKRKIHNIQDLSVWHWKTTHH